MFKTFYEDFDVGDQRTFGPTTVEKSEVIEFASKYDPQPFHLDEALAKHSVFGGLCASGWHTAAMTMGMMVRGFMAEQIASMGSPGVSDMKWLKPVFPGDILSATAKVTSRRESESRANLGFIGLTVTVYNQDQTAVMSLDTIMMILKKNQ